VTAASSGKLTVVLVDDSSSVRAVLRRFLAQSPDIQVIGEAADGEAAVDLVERLRPDVLLLDIVMPVLDGFGVLARLRRDRLVPCILLTSRADRSEVRAAFHALGSGAVELLPKPEDPDSWHLLAETLPAVIRAAAAARVSPPTGSTGASGTGGSMTSSPTRGGSGVFALPAALFPPASPRSGREVSCLAIGASTGGPAAVRDLLAALPAPAPFPILIVQHIAAGFESGLADWLATTLGLDVRIALAGEQPGPGAVRIAPGGAHLRLGSDGRLELDTQKPPRRGHRPSVDELFHSLERGSPQTVVAALLTGMGTDGAEGLRDLRRAGALCCAQDEPSSAVFGMPRAAIELGAAELVLPPAAIGAEIARRLREAR
jgi:two-component system, chemotaxis family, protein-glutamate methylesterase/glutaminase